MTHFLNNYVFGTSNDEQIIGDEKELVNNTLKKIVLSKFTPYLGKTVTKLKSMFNIKTSAKNINELIAGHIMGLKRSPNFSKEFQKGNIVCKTIRVEESGKIKEHMSFKKINFLELDAEDEWENSVLYNSVVSARFLFIIFKNNGEDYVLNSVKFWNMPFTDSLEVKKVWQKTKKTILEPVIGGKYGFSLTNLPKQSESCVSHVRPHDRNMQIGKNELPNGKKIAGYCFWLNSKYVETILKRFIK